VRDEQSDPVFSIIIPTHNRWPFVADAIESALAQRGDAPEVIVVDDGSTDGTAELVHAGFPRATVVRQPNRERGAARNEGVRRARGRWVTFLDSDDVLDPGHLEALLPPLAAGAPVVASRGALWRPESGPGRLYGAPPAGPSYTLEQTLLGNPILICCLGATPEHIWRAGGFPEDRAVAGSEDWVLMLRLLSLGPIPSVEVVTALIRDHPGRSMADPTGIVRSRDAAARLVLDEGLPGRRLEARERALVLAGSAYFAAAHLYEAGRMRDARRRLREVVALLGIRGGTAKAARLYAQSLLGARLTLLARALRHGR
jgi:glycosyltransferase involved in cell wall biosynthesis